jgi:hypothetical protein
LHREGLVIWEGSTPVATFITETRANETVRSVNAQREKDDFAENALRQGSINVSCPYCESAGLIPRMIPTGSTEDYLADIRLGHVAVCHPTVYATTARARHDAIYMKAADAARERAKEAEKRRCANSGHGVGQYGPSDWEWRSNNDGYWVCDMCDEVIDFDAMSELKIPGYRFGGGRITFSSDNYARDIAAGWRKPEAD